MSWLLRAVDGNLVFINKFEAIDVIIHKPITSDMDVQKLINNVTQALQRRTHLEFHQLSAWIARPISQPARSGYYLFRMINIINQNYYHYLFRLLLVKDRRQKLMQVHVNLWL